jgi:MFS transporter, Spinster family, sphingosine-1-phosphate transporter
VLAVLAAINLLNYLDRFIMSAVLPWVDDAFTLSDRQSGLLGSVFMIVHLAASPFAGYLGDRRPRRFLVAGGVALWSLATLGSGLADSYASLLAMRALVGIGEAGYATVAPSMIADLFSEGRRGRMLAWFYLAIPVGTALGYLLGGTVAEHYGWRSAFFVAGLPGLVASVVALTLPEPVRGGSDGPPEPSEATLAEAGISPPATRLGARDSWRRVLSSPVWRYDTLATATVTFTLGGLAFWMPTFLMRSHGTTGQDMGWLLGAVLLVAGLVSTPLGGYLGDLRTLRRPAGHLEVSALSMAASVPFIVLVPLLPSLASMLVATFGALFLLGLTIGPINAALVASVPATLRSTAVALNLVLVHLLGDALSPWLIGWISDTVSLAVAMALTAVPVAIGALLLLHCARQVNRIGGGLDLATGSRPEPR